MDNKRKGSASPSNSDSFKWDASASRDPFAFADDDDGPVPAPPEFDGQRGGMPELLDADEIVEAEVIEDPELLDSALITEVRPTHAMPPPIPAPVPTGPGQRAFLDDGEIALPPRISRIAQSFPFRRVRAEPDPSAEELLDDDTLEPSTFRSAALGSDADDPAEEAEPEELDADELEAAEEVIDDEPAPPPRRMPAPPSRDPIHSFTDDDDDAGTVPRQPAHSDPALRFTDDENPRFADDDDEQPFAPREQPVTDDDDTRSEPSPHFVDETHPDPALRFADDDDASLADPALRFAGELPPADPTDDDTTQHLAWQPRDRGRNPAQMFVDDERSADTVADGSIAGVNDDDTGLFPDVRQNSPTGLFARDTLQNSARRGNPPVSASHSLPDDDDEPTGMFAVDRLRELATATGQQPQQLHDEDGPLPRGPQPSAAIPVAAFDDDDDETWATPSRSGPPSSSPASPSSSSMTARVPSTGPSSAGPPSASSSSATLRPPVMQSAPMTMPPAIVAPPPIVAQTDDSEGSGIGGWIARRPGSSMASGAIAVADFADDDEDWPGPKPVPITTPPAAADDDDEATREAPASTADADADADSDADDDEWEPHAATVNLAPAPTDLGEPFPLDLWSDPDELVGRDLGQYRLERPLSRGMTTRVYLAKDLGEDPDSGRQVAIRVLGPMHSPAEPRARQFLYEAQQLAKLKGEHVVEVLATGTTHDHLSYYVMELLTGETLASSLRSQGPLPWADVAAFANQICDALILAADRGIVHTDLTASTCIRIPAESAHSEGGRDTIKLLGVGVSPLTSVFRNPDGSWALSANTPMGAAEFMAPELASGGQPDARTAVYAVGVLMYELATGRPPFRGESFIAVLKKQMYDEPASPRQQVPEQEIPDVFEAALLRALAKAPGDRFENLRALDEALLAARAREGELRRVTQILALDPAFWDEDGSRRVKQTSAPQQSADPTPLATFAADLKANQPELAAKVFNRPDPPRSSRGEPSIALHLTQLAAPITAPALPSAQPQQQQMPVIVVSRPPTSSNSSLFRNVSLAIVIASVVVVAALWLSDRNRGPSKKPSEVAADSRRPPTSSKSKSKTTREPKPRDTPVADNPLPTVLPPSDPEEKPEPEVIQAPPSDPEPEPEPKVIPPPEPEPKVIPPPEIKTPPPEVKTPETKKPETTAVKPVKPPRDPLDDRPDSITNGRLEAKLGSMQERVATRCRSKAGVPDPRGLKVSVRVTVDTKGEVKAKATAPWGGTPLGQCIEEMLEAIRFNETRSGGGRTHTFTF